jgi:hypothetical protein
VNGWEHQSFEVNPIQSSRSDSTPFESCFSPDFSGKQDVIRHWRDKK